MPKTDPVADMLTRIRNGIQAKAAFVEIPASKLKIEIAKILKTEGLIAGYSVREEGRISTLRIELARAEMVEPLIKSIQRTRRVELKGPFATKDDVKRVMDWEKSLAAPSVIRQKGDLYETLLETVNRSLGISGN